MREIIKVKNIYKNQSEESKREEITRKIEKLINSENKNKIA